MRGRPRRETSINALIQPGVLEREGTPLHYWLTGPEHGPLVVLVHGAGVDHHMFDAQVAALADAYRVLTWDLRWHGSSRPGGGPFSLGVLVDDLLALLERVGAAHTPIVAVGQSLGGNLAQELVFRHPARVRALVVIGSACNTLPVSLSERLALWVAPAILRGWPYEKLVEASAQFSAVRPEVQAYVQRAMSRLSQAEFSTVMTATIAGLHHERGYRIEQPLLLTHGADDRTGNIRKVAPRWAARDPQCRYVVVPDAGHCANQDNPEFFNPLLLDFLHDLPRT